LSHYYKVNGYKLPSVTTIISDCLDKSKALTAWSARMVVLYVMANYKSKPLRDLLLDAQYNYKRLSQEALDIGSAVHGAIERYLCGKEPYCTKAMIRGFCAFQDWLQDKDIETIATEQTISTKLWAGTLDWKLLLNGKQGVIDFKTSTGFYAGMGEQTAAYRSVDTDNKFNAILRLDKTTGLPEYKDYSKTYERDLTTFRFMVGQYYSRHPRIRKNAGVSMSDIVSMLQSGGKADAR